MTVWNCMWLKYMTCALPCWITGRPLSVSIRLSFHSLLLFLLCLCQSSMPFRRCLLKLFLSLTRTTQTLLWHVLPLPPSCLLFFFFFWCHCFWEQFTLPYLLLSYSFILAKPVGEPPSSLSLSILLVSKSPRGISDSLADLPLLHLKAGWLNFSFTFLQLSSNQLCRYLLKRKLSSTDWRGTLYGYKSLSGTFRYRDLSSFSSVHSSRYHSLVISVLTV